MTKQRQEVVIDLIQFVISGLFQHEKQSASERMAPITSVYFVSRGAGQQNVMQRKEQISMACFLAMKLQVCVIHLEFECCEISYNGCLEMHPRHLLYEPNSIFKDFVAFQNLASALTVNGLAGFAD